MPKTTNISKSKFYITHLYPEEMSIYGDQGNIIAMQYILGKLGIESVYQKVGCGQNLPTTTDWYFIGGGQDKEQLVIYKDLQKKSETIIQDIKKGVGLLAICGGYQLLGKEFITGNGVSIPGIGLFEVLTKAPSTNVKSRCVGNIILNCLIPEVKGRLVGFENHSGQTYFSNNSRCIPLGKVLVGNGNNVEEKLEGCVYKNAVGTYLHGSCLPKNPELTLWFIRNQMKRKKLQLGDIKIDLEIATTTKQFLVDRFGD